MPSHIVHRHETNRLVVAEAERPAGHEADFKARARILSDLKWDRDRLGLSSSQLHAVLGLEDGSLGSRRLPTEALQAALERMREMLQ